MPGERFSTRRISNSIIDTAAISAAALVLMAVWLPDKVPVGHSLYFNLTWMNCFVAQFLGGDIYPRWIEALWDGAGGADFFFYAPLPFWVGGLARTICPSCDADALIVSTAVLWLVLSGVAFRALAGRFLDDVPALCGAILYMALPYHLAADWADRQALAEFAAIAFVPLHFSAAVGCLERERHAALKLAILTALILLCHLPTALIVGIGYVPFAVAFARSLDAGAVPRLALAAILGAGLSAIHWYPALTLLDTVNAQALEQEAVSWRYHFMVLDFQLDQQAVFAIGLTSVFIAVTILCVCAIALVGTARSPAVRFALALLATVWFLATPISLPIWEHSPVSAVQFPWRFLILADLAIALIAARCVQHVRATNGRPRTLGLMICAALVAVVAMEHPAIRGERKFWGNVALAVSLSAGAREWLPRELDDAEKLTLNRKVHAVARSLTSTPPVSTGLGQDLRLIRLSPTQARLEGTLRAPDAVTIKRTYWRYWQLTDADTGTEIALRPTTGFPLIRADLPAGDAHYLLTLRLPREVWIGRGISLASLLVIVAGALFPFRPGTLRRGQGRRSGEI